MKEVRRSSREHRQSAENVQPRSSSKRSRKSLAAETTTVMTRRRSRSNISENRSPSPTGSTLPPEEITPSPEVYFPNYKIIGDKKVDAYCWMCHKPADESYCEKCPRVFHTDCRKKLNQSLMCECSYTTVDGNQERYIFSPETLKKVLIHVTEKYMAANPETSPKKSLPEIKKYEKFFRSWPKTPESSRRVCFTVDINYLIDKIHSVPPIRNTGSFFSLVKWLYHNCFIVYGADSERTHAASQLEKQIRQELMDVEACGECFERMHIQEHVHSDFFATLCEHPHQIVWAKLRGSPFWPAKLLRVRENGHADVRFFGTHDRSVMPSSQLLKFSKEYPAKKEISKSKFKDAMAEVSLYISNFESKNGDFRYYPKNTPYLQKSKSPVGRPYKRKRSVSRTNHPEDSPNNSSSGSPRKQMIKPSLNISILHEESSPDVRCHMTYQIDEENCANELNTSDDFIRENAKPESSVPEIQRRTLYPVASSTTGGFMNSIESRENDPNQSSNTLPVITSTVSSGSSDESRNVISPPSAVFNEEFSHMTSSNPADSNHENSFPTENALSQILRSVDNIPDDDEVQLVEETRGKNPRTEILTKTSSRINALFDLLLLAKPGVKENCGQLMENIKRSVLNIWLEVGASNLNEDCLRGYQIIYEKCLKEMQLQARRIEVLEKENYELCGKVKDLESRIDIKNLLKDHLIRHTVNQEKQRVERNCEEQIEKYKSEFLRELKKKDEECKKREEELKEDLKEDLKKKDEEINLMSIKMNELKAELERYKKREIKENGHKILRHAEIQTDVLSIFPDRNKKTNLVSTSIHLDNDYSNQQKPLIMQCQRSLVYTPSSVMGLHGSFYAESSKFATLEHVPVSLPPGFNPNIMGQDIVSPNIVSSNIVSPNIVSPNIVSPNIVSPNIVPLNSVPSHSNTAMLRNTIPGYQRLSSPSSSKSNPKFPSYSPAKNSRKRHK